MRNRRSIRTKIIGMIAVPLLALIAMWLFALSSLVGSALELRSTSVLSSQVQSPGEQMVTELQKERKLTQLYLAVPGTSESALAAQRSRTDAAISTFRRLSGSSALRGVANDLTIHLLQRLSPKLDGLAEIRSGVDVRSSDRATTLSGYNDIIDVTFDVFFSMTTLRDSTVAKEAYSVQQVSLSTELLNQLDALYSGVAVAGHFGDSDYQNLVQIVGAFNFEFADAVAGLPLAEQNAFALMNASSDFAAFSSLSQELVSSGKAAGIAPVSLGTWQGRFDTVDAGVRAFGAKAEAQNLANSQKTSNRILLELTLTGAIGLVIVLGSILVSVRVARSLISRLAGLRTAAKDLAEVRLPSVVRRLRTGEDVDVAAEAPALVAGVDEIGELGEAFTSVQRTAISSAVDEAALRRGVNEVFLNIARRSQTLLHRQLALLDQMERRVGTPEDLEDLFRVDHLATRMRRHAEDLVILAGATPSRGWRNPVPLVDVVRGAVSEVEDYARVTISAVPEAALLGRAVGDMIHLLAELIENATSYSPPHTRVHVLAQQVGAGYAIEIEDRGLGMAAGAVESANRRLSEPPDFDLSNSAQLGLHVVAQLANRHGIKVVLRPSPYGGIIAVVLVPTDLVIGAPTTVPALSRVAATLEARVVAMPRELVAAPVNGTNGHRPQIQPRYLDPATHSDPARNPAEPGPALNHEFQWLGRHHGDDLASRAPLTPPPGPVTPLDWAAPLDPATPMSLDPETPLAPAWPTPPEAAPALWDPPTAAWPDAQPKNPGAFSSGTAEPAERRMLPRRVRQASIAPQLREEANGTSPAAPAVPGTRSPDQLRSMMSAFQSGTLRGRTTGPGTEPDHRPTTDQEPGE
jgi:signal transduction histidine kinase